jgi:hypothetical protein
MASIPNPSGNQDVALVLAGGNAVGAYLAGAYEQLHEQAVRPRLSEPSPDLSWRATPLRTGSQS